MNYRIKSTECEVKLDYIQERENASNPKLQVGKKLARPIYHFVYTNRAKPGFTVYQEDLDRNLNFEVWIKLPEVQ